MLRRPQALAWEEVLAKVRNYVPMVGRLLLAHIFLIAGVMKIFTWEATAASMENHGMQAVPFFLVMTILFEIGGALSVILGWQARLGALALIAFLIPVTLVFHNFWAYTDPLEQQQQMQNFMKNLAILGGLLLVASFGPGRLSLDSRKELVS